MAIAWLSILKAVPWNEVVSNSPKVADGAKKLWEALVRKKSSADVPNGTAATSRPEAPTLNRLAIQLADLTA